MPNEADVFVNADQLSALPGRARELSTEQVRILNGIANAKLRTSRFPGLLEDENHHDVRESSRIARIGLTLLPLLACAVTPLWQLFFMHPPAGLLPLLLSVQLGIVPLTFSLTAWVQLRHSRSSFAEWLLLAAFLLLIICFEAIRYRAGSLGMIVESYLVTTIPVAVITLARLRLSRSLLLLSGYLLILASSHYLQGAVLDLRNRQEWILETLLLSIALLSSAWTALSARRQWAAKLLLELMAYRDPLTGLPNRRAFEEHYETASRAVYRGHSRKLFFALLDIDHFKRVNDTYGHAYGDGVLVEFGVVLAQFARRPLDLAARLGGEEFALVLFDCDLTDGTRRVNELLQQIRELQIEHRGNPCGVVTCSGGGVAVGPAHPLYEAYHAADLCLYRAKNEGRDRLTVADHS
jgi:diguanylate cyclase (GGDEF)-like protein